MASFFFIFIIVFFSLAGEIILSSTGAIIPITALTLYYLTANTNISIPIVCAIASGFIIDAYFYRSITMSPAIFLAIVALAHFWSKNNSNRFFILNLLPGAAIAFICTFPFFIYSNIKLGLTQDSILDYLKSMSVTLTISVVLLPLISFLLDYAKEIMELPFFTKNSKDGVRNWK